MINELPHTNIAPRFASLAALKTANNELIKRRKSEDPHLIRDVVAFIQKGSATGAILNVENERWTCQSILDYWANFLDRNDRLTVPHDVLLASFDPKLAIDIPDSKCPYVGLQAFGESKQAAFFGRQRLIEELLHKISNTRCLAIVGSSGSGKSSLVLAGILPMLKTGAVERSELWQYLPSIVPGLDPLASLASLVPCPKEAKEEEWIAEHVRGLKGSNSYLLELINRHKFEAVLIVVDQLEEIFTLTGDETIQRAFINNLLSLVEYPDLRHTLILTMRSEFETYVAKSPQFDKYFQQAIRVTPLTALEVRDAIQKPAELVGLKFEDGIVDELVNETIGEPAGLPLLQFTMFKLWQMRQHDLVTADAFRKLGSCREALTRAADEFFNKLTPTDQSKVKWIMLRLVRPGPGGGLEVFNNRVIRKTLYKSPVDRQHIDRVLDGLIESGLIRETEGTVSGDKKVEVAHEALVRHWRRLVGWLDEERVNLGRRLSLSEAAEEWDLSGRDSLNLLRGAQLDEALRFEDLNILEAEFVARSQKRKIWSKRQLYGSSVIATIGLIVLATVFYFQARSSAAKERKASSRALAAKALLFKDRLDVALLLSVEAYKADHTAEARNSLFSLLFGDNASRQMTYLRGSKPRALSINDQSELTSLNSDGTIKIWNLRSPEADPTIPYTGVPNASAFALSANGNVAAISINSGKIVVFDPRTGRTTHNLSMKKDPSSFEYAETLRLSGDGSILAALDAETENVHIWDLKTGTSFRIPERESFIGNLTLSQNGDLMAFASWLTGIKIWDVRKNKLLRKITLRNDADTDTLALSPDGKFVAWSTDNEVSVQETSGGTLVKYPLYGRANQKLTDLFFSADSKKLISTSENGTILISEFQMNAEDRFRERTISVQAPSGGVFATTLSADQEMLVAATQRGDVILWNLNKYSRLLTEFEAIKAPVFSIAISTDGRLVAGGTNEGTIVFWDAFTGRLTGPKFITPTAQHTNEAEVQQGKTPLVGHQSSDRGLIKLVFSSDNKLLAALSLSGEGIVWDMETGASKSLPVTKDEAVVDLTLCPDGKCIAWIGKDSAKRSPRLERADLADPTTERNLTMWRLTTNSTSQVVAPRGKYSLAGLAYSHDGKTLAACDKNGAVTLWDPSAGTVISNLQNPQGVPQGPRTDEMAMSLAFSTDDKILAVAYPSPNITFWDLVNHRVLEGPVMGNIRRVRRMTVSSIGGAEMMTSSGFEEGIVLWDVNARQSLGTIKSPFSVVDQSLAPNMRFLIVGGEKTASWDLSVESWLRVACQIANRKSLTENEWKNYVGGEVKYNPNTCN